jgi:anti-anti-sigma factor
MALTQDVPAATGPVRLAPTQRVSRVDGHTVVLLSGEHDLSSLFALAEALSIVIAIDDDDLVVDLSEVQFMGAETVGVLIRARSYLQTQSRSLTLRSPAPCAQRVLDLCWHDDFPHLRLVAPVA